MATPPSLCSIDTPLWRKSKPLNGFSGWMSESPQSPVAYTVAEVNIDTPLWRKSKPLNGFAGWFGEEIVAHPYDTVEVQIDTPLWNKKANFLTYAAQTPNLIDYGILPPTLVGRWLENPSRQVFKKTLYAFALNPLSIDAPPPPPPPPPAVNHGSGVNTGKFKKSPVPIDYASLWLLKTMGTEDRYFGSRVRIYFPSISENLLSNAITNIVTDMRNWFLMNPVIHSPSLIDAREKELIKFYALQALKQHNSTVILDESKFKPGLLS